MCTRCVRETKEPTRERREGTGAGAGRRRRGESVVETLVTIGVKGAASLSCEQLGQLLVSFVRVRESMNNLGVFAEKRPLEQRYACNDNLPPTLKSAVSSVSSRRPPPQSATPLRRKEPQDNSSLEDKE